MKNTNPKVQVVKTIGHSTHPLDKLVAILQAHHVNQVIDIRKMPRSRSNPQFNFETLGAELGKCGIEYRHMPGLAGLRKVAKESLNTAWRNKSFQAFADYMQTEEFEKSITELMTLSNINETALMCAEVLPWRCHRFLVADALTARGIAVQHLMSEAKAYPHVMPDFALVTGTKVTYPLQT